MFLGYHVCLNNVKMRDIQKEKGIVVEINKKLKQKERLKITFKSPMDTSI